MNIKEQFKSNIQNNLAKPQPNASDSTPSETALEVRDDYAFIPASMIKTKSLK